MSQYILSDWRNDNPEDPFIVFGQIDSERYAERIIDVFRDGRADAIVCEGNFYEPVPAPEVETINEADEFTACYVSASLFEATWQEATDTRRLSPTSINNLTQTLHNPDHPTQGA